MCGRYEFSLKGTDKITKQLKERIEKLDLKDFQEGEVYPGNKCLVFIAKGEGKIELDVKKWGIPGKSFLINARMESIEEKSFFRELKKNRCIIIANGFYEWKDKEKHYIRKEDPFIYLAGIYDKNNEFLIVTGEAEGEMKKIHDRSPIIYDQKEMLKYLFHRKELKVDDQELIINKVPKIEEPSLF